MTDATTAQQPPPTREAVNAIQELGCIATMLEGTYSLPATAKNIRDQTAKLAAQLNGAPTNNGRVGTTQGSDEPQIRTLRSAHPTAQQPPPCFWPKCLCTNTVTCEHRPYPAQQPEAPPTQADGIDEAKLAKLSRKELYSIIDEFRSERDAAKRSVMRAFDERNIALNQLAASRERERANNADARRWQWFRELSSEEIIEFIKDVEAREEDETYPDASAGYTPTARRASCFYVDEAADASMKREGFPAAAPDSAASPTGGEG